MRTLLLSFDRKTFEEGTSSRARFAAYGRVCDEVHIIVYALATLDLAPAQISPNVWLHPTNSRSRLGYMRDAMRIAETLSDGGKPRFDIVSAQDPCETGFPGWLIARRHRVPLQLQDHIDVFDPAFIRERPLNMVRAIMALFLLPRADGIRAVSPASAARVARVLPRVRDRIGILPVYVDLAELRDATPAFALAERYPESDGLILMASRFVPQKDLPLALAAFRVLLRSHPRARLLMIGEGPQQAMLDAAATAEPRMTILPWQRDLVSYYKGATAFFLTSHYESYCRTLVEAAACGASFVSTDVGVARSLVEAGASGIVPPGRSAEALAHALASVLDGSPARDPAKSAEAAFKLNSASLDEYLGRYRQLLDTCMDRANRVPSRS